MLIPNSPTAALNRQKFSQKPPQFEPSILTLRTAAVRRPLVAALEPPRFPHFDAQLAKTLLLIAHSTLGALVGRPALLSRGDSRPNKLRLFFFRSSHPHLLVYIWTWWARKHNQIDFAMKVLFSPAPQQQKTSVDFVVSPQRHSSAKNHKCDFVSLF